MQPVRGIEETRRPAGRKKEPSGLFFSVWVPISRNVYRGCCNLQPVRGIEGTRPPAGGKKEPGGLFFSVTGCGTQRLQRPLEGPCILLAAAPTTPPCFCRRQRSSSLLFKSSYPLLLLKRNCRIKQKRQLSKAVSLVVRVAIQNFLKNIVISMVSGFRTTKFLACNFIFSPQIQGDC